MKRTLGKVMTIILVTVTVTATMQFVQTRNVSAREILPDATAEEYIEELDTSLTGQPDNMDPEADHDADITEDTIDIEEPENCGIGTEDHSPADAYGACDNNELQNDMETPEVPEVIFWYDADKINLNTSSTEGEVFDRLRAKDARGITGTNCELDRVYILRNKYKTLGSFEWVGIGNGDGNVLEGHVYAIELDVRASSGFSWPARFANKNFNRFPVFVNGNNYTDILGMEMVGNNNVLRIRIPIGRPSTIASVTVDNESGDSIYAGSDEQFTADVIGTAETSVKWAVSGNNNEKTTIDEDTGLLTISKDENAEKLTITATATSTADGTDKKSGSYEVNVIPADTVSSVSIAYPLAPVLDCIENGKKISELRSVLEDKATLKPATCSFSAQPAVCHKINGVVETLSLSDNSVLTDNEDYYFLFFVEIIDDEKEGKATWPASFSSMSSRDKYRVGDVSGFSVSVNGRRSPDSYITPRGDVLEIYVPIEKSSLKSATISGVKNVTYTGKTVSQTPTVKIRIKNGKDGRGRTSYTLKTLTKGRDFSVSYDNNINAGTAKMTVTGTGLYRDSATTTFEIYKANQVIRAQDFEKMTGDKPFNIGARTSGDGNLSYKSSDTNVADVDADGNVTVKGKGTVTITITAAATTNYNAATKAITVNVTEKKSDPKPVAKDISKATVSGIRNKTYTGKAIKQSPAVKLNGKTLRADTDYTLSYKNNKNAGTATVIITGKGNYKGTVRKTFTIKKAANKLSVKAKEATYRVDASELKNSKKSISGTAIYKFTNKKKTKGTIKYTLSSVKNGSKKVKKGFSVNKSNGKLTINKKVANGSYKITVKVTAGNKNYKTVNKNVKFTVKIK